MNYPKKHIITGAPGTGKTTLIEALKAEGYPCMPEVSRQVIILEQQSGSTGTPWQDIVRFADLVFHGFLGGVAAYPEALFTDRSPIDLIAYLYLEGKPIFKELDQYPYSEKFRKRVFFAPTWESIYHPDEQRQQDFAYCLELEGALVNVYTERSFELVYLPKEPVAQRVTFVKRHLENGTNH